MSSTTSYTTENFPELKNDLILRAARGEVTTHSPVWIMRQAGRYLPEFREERAKADFFTICRTPALACEVTLQPLRRFPLDAAIIFCDILVIPQALGMEVQMIKGTGPHFPEPLTTPEDIKKLDGSNITKKLNYVFEAITLTRHKLEGKVPLIGFTGGPWTLMAYMIEGGGSKTYSKAKGWLYQHPDACHTILNMITEASIEYLTAQARAGAQLLKVFESWSGFLSEDHFNTFLLPYIARIAKEVKANIAKENLGDIPMLIFAKGAHYSIPKLCTETQFNVIALDWTMDPLDVIATIKSLPESSQRKICLQGNLDPCAFFGSNETIIEETKKVLAKFKGFPHIANLGHGMLPTHRPEAVAVFVETVHSFEHA